MHIRQCFLPARRIAIAVLAVSFFATHAFAAAPTEKVLYRFLGPPDGMSPLGGLVADAAGDLYGTTVEGGIDVTCCGTVFELSPPATAGGDWTETVLHTFQQGGNTDGAFPSGTLIIDKRGNLYGTTQSASNSPGSIFELSPPPTTGGSWTYTVLWTFDQDGSQGSGPAGALIMDAAGNLYGTTQYGGITACN